MVHGFKDDVKFQVIYRKNNFHRADPKYGDFIIIGEFPKKRSTVYSFLFEKIFLAENTLYMIFDQQIFSTEIFKNS